MEGYAEELNSKEWRRKRYRILKRDHFTCQNCGEYSRQGKYLHVHHLYYIFTAMAWEYNDDALVTLCEECHKQLHQEQKITIYADKDRSKPLNLTPCQRCGGLGYIKEYLHIDNGICYRCMGMRFEELIKKTEYKESPQRVKSQSTKNIEEPSYDELKSLSENLSTEITDEDLKDAITDDYGAKYSKDGSKLLSVPTYMIRYSIKPGTLVICNQAFNPEVDTYKHTMPHIDFYCYCIGIDPGVSSSPEEDLDMEWIYREKPHIKFVSIPNSVIKIGECAFFECEKLKQIILPNSVASIGEFAFSGCVNLEKVTLSTSISSIPRGCFEDCAFTKIHIPELVETIEESAFLNCDKLTVVDSDARIKKINVATFYGCKSLIEPFIPSTVQELQECAFYGCSSLSEVYIPKCVKTIKINSFECCENLKKFDVDSRNRCYSSDNDGVMYTKPFDTLVLYPPHSNTQYTIREGVKIIGEFAFLGNKKLKTIDCPDTIEKIGPLAFAGCTNLEYVSLSNNLVSIESAAFQGCSHLQYIRMPASLETIGENVFSGSSIIIMIINSINPPSLTIEAEDWVSGIMPSDRIAIYIPEESLEIYKNADGWKSFSHFVPLTPWDIF